ncbi:MAG: helix-turn-helix domain-containing protein [Gammaproteobacteria bacterium]
MSAPRDGHARHRQKRLTESQAPVEAEKSRPGVRQTSTDVASAFQRLVGEIFRLNGQLLATAEKLSHVLDLGPARWQTMAVIRDEPLPVSRIARQLGLRRQSVQYNVDRLVAQGLAELTPNPHHRRARLVGLTTAGRAAMFRLADLQLVLARRFVGNSGLTTAALTRMATDLRRMRLEAESHKDS